eukprot:jgi/Ulvmu1/12326/UM089_0010.1
MGNSNIHDRSGSLGDDVLQRLQQVEDISDSIPFDPLDTQRRLMSRRAHGSSHAPAKSPGKALAGKASRSRRELASPDDISNTMSLLACTDATHTASCRSAGVSRDPRGRDAATAHRCQAQLPVIEDSTSMSPYYGVPPPEPFRPENSHTGALPDHPESPISSQGVREGPANPADLPPDPPAQPSPPAAAALPPPPPPRQEVAPSPWQPPPPAVKMPPDAPAAQRPPSWRPEPPVPAPARLHHPTRTQAAARPRAEAPTADMLAAPQPVDKVLLDRFLAAAADTQGVPEDAHGPSTISSTGSAAPPAATMNRAVSPGKPAPRNPAATAAMYLTPRRGATRPGDGAQPIGSRPQQHAQSAINALYRFATLAAERRAGGNASAPTVPPLAAGGRRAPGVPRHSLSGELKPLLQEDSQLSPRPQASVATATPREEPSPRLRGRSASRNRRPWGCICFMPDVDEGSSFEQVPLVASTELSTRGAPRQAIRPQQPQHASPLLHSGRLQQNPALAMYKGAASATHAHRSPLGVASTAASTPRQSGQPRRGGLPPQHAPPVAGTAGSTPGRSSPRPLPAADPPRLPTPHWRDTNRKELKQGSPLQHSQDAAHAACRRCGMSACRCSARAAQPIAPPGECTPHAAFCSPRPAQTGYTSQPLRSPRPDSSYAGSALQRSDSQPVHGEALQGGASHGRASRSLMPPRMLGALGEYRGGRAAPVRPGPFGGPTESQPFRTMQQAMAAQVPPTAAVAAQRVQAGFRTTPQPLEATSSWALSAQRAAQSMATGVAVVPVSESGESSAMDAAAQEDALDAAPEAEGQAADVPAQRAQQAQAAAASASGADGEACAQLAPPQSGHGAARPPSQTLVAA